MPRAPRGPSADALARRDAGADAASATSPNRRPRTFSGGEAQRVALARAFARSPALVLLDEPFSALDRELKQELWLDVRQTIEQLGIPAIQVTHQVDEARAMGQRMIRMERGRVIETGNVASLRDENDGHETTSTANSRVSNG